VRREEGCIQFSHQACIVVGCKSRSVEELKS
jgi:hypothetical protein